MKIIALSLCFLLLFVSASSALSINDPAPLFSLRDCNGDFFHLSDYVNAPNPPLTLRGGKGELEASAGWVKGSAKGVIVNFFSSTCKPCKNELSVLNSLVDEFNKKGIKIVVIGWREDFDKFDEMLTSLKVDKPIILSDVYGITGKKYMINGLPRTFFIGSDGKIKDIIIGEQPNIEKLLREKAGKLLK